MLIGKRDLTLLSYLLTPLSIDSFNVFYSKDEEIGGHMIQQNVAGRPVTVFRFPPRTKLKALSHATVSIINFTKSFTTLAWQLERVQSNLLNIVFQERFCFRTNRTS